MLDKFIEENKGLIQKAKELAQKEDLATNLYKEANALRKKFHFSRDDDESFFEKELADEFDSYLNQIYAKIKDSSLNAEELKNNIIKEAKALLLNTNFKKASPVMKDLLEKWKIAGHTDKEKDDALWEEFNNIRNEFYEARDAYYDNLKKEFKANEEKKLALIEEAVEANKIVDIKELTDKMNDLMKKWKAVKTATKEKDDELWSKFQAQRDIFFKKKNSYFEAMKEVYEKRKEEKEELIKEAKHLLAMSEFSKEEIARVEEIRNKWKEIGSAGKEYENELWDKFKTIINRYLDNKKYYE